MTTFSDRGVTESSVQSTRHTKISEIRQIFNIVTFQAPVRKIVSA